MADNIVISRKFFFLLITACFLSTAYVLYSVHQVAAKEASQVDRYKDLKILTDVLALVERNYVEPVKPDEMIEGAVKGMLSTLDPHSGYLSKEYYSELQVETKGEFGGLGIEITMKDGVLTVVSPIEDSPAADAGVLAGDQIVKIGDELARDLSLVDAVKKMRGLKGTPITITLQRTGKKAPFPVTIIRDVIKVKSVRYRMLDTDIGYIRLAQFQEGTTKEFKKALEALDKKSSAKKLKGLVLDLRNDPGGLLTEAIKVADIFLKDGIVVYTDGRLESQKQKYYAHDDSNEPIYPLIALINGGSASASEIVAGALQDARRAVIVGEQSFGKGSVQTILPMERGDALRLTTALYYTKSGRSIQAQGVTPDRIVVDPRFATKEPEGDSVEEEKIERLKEKDLPGAIKNPATKEKEKKTGEEAAKTEVKKSEQLVIGSRAAIEADLATLLKEDLPLAEALKMLKSGEVKYDPSLATELKPSTDSSSSIAASSSEIGEAKPTPTP